MEIQCSKCLVVIGPGSKFCQKCGEPVLNSLPKPSKESSRQTKASEIEEPKITPKDEGKLFSEIAEARRLENQAQAKANRQAARQKHLDEMRERLRLLVDRFNSRKKLSYPLGAMFVLAFLYGLIQIGLETVIGPELQVNNYMQAVRSGNADALEDGLLFPRGYDVAPTYIQDARVEIQPESVTMTSINREGDVATAEIDINGGSVSLRLEKEHHLILGFYVPVWKVLNPAPSLFLSSPIGHSPNQLVTFSGSSYKLSELPPTNYTVLPGSYEISLSGYGFMADSTTTYSVLNGHNVVELKYGEMGNLGNAEAKARSSMVSKAKSCLRKGCSSLGKFKVGDFNLWSQYTEYSTYTSSKFTKKFKYSSCGPVTYNVISPTRLQANMSCNGTVRGHLYVKYVYYYGYFSDYWYYWNFYDSKNTSVNVSADLTMSKSGAVRVSGVKLG